MRMKTLLLVMLCGLFMAACANEIVVERTAESCKSRVRGVVLAHFVGLPDACKPEL